MAILLVFYFLYWPLYKVDIQIFCVGSYRMLTGNDIHCSSNYRVNQGVYNVLIIITDCMYLFQQFWSENEGWRGKIILRCVRCKQKNVG